MNPVEQKEGYGCLRACVASIFELEYEQVPAELAVQEGQTTAFVQYMASRGFAVGDYSLYGANGVPDTPQQRCVRYFPTMWIASVLSPRLRDECEPCGGDGLAEGGGPCLPCRGRGWTPGWHAVVMRGSTLVWDPHPLRADGHWGFAHAHVPYVIDPARVVVRVIP